MTNHTPNQHQGNEDMQKILEYTRANPDKFHAMERCEKILFERREYGQKHNAYEREVREFQAIEAGNPDLLEHSLLENLGGELGTLSNDALRNQKDLAIVVITLASRAAIRGGMNPELAFSLSDSYIQILEQLDDRTQVALLAFEAEFAYAHGVQAAQQSNHTSKNKKNASSLRKEENIHVRHCKEYIFLHLHDRIHIQDIADSLGLNASYLSQLFHRETGTTVKEFIRIEKINLAKNMLIYSQYSYSEIANYLVSAD